MSRNVTCKEAADNDDDFNNEACEAKTGPELSSYHTSTNTVRLNLSKENEETETKGAIQTQVLRRVTKITNEDIDEHLSKYEFFHGFMLHEYQPMLLRNFGDYLLRLSVRYQKKKKEKMSVKKDSKDDILQKSVMVSDNTSKNIKKNARYHLVLGVFTGQAITQETMQKSIYHDCLDDNQKSRDIADVPLIIENDQSGKWCIFYIDKKKRFTSIDELIAYYKENAAVHKDNKFNLLNGVPLQSWEIDRKQIDIGTKQLGEGAFGEVRIGTMKSLPSNELAPVAVKMLKTEESKGMIKLMMHEARLQLCLKHKNVLRTLGVCIIKPPFLIVTEFCGKGSLKDYLQKNKVEVNDKIKFCYGSALGTEYIHRKQLIHRDLATRNVLLTDKFVPKIADFGLARYGTSYKMTTSMKIPIRYLAPEVLSSFRFSLKSDVYSFGLVIWEIFENGQEPYVKPQPHQESLFPKVERLKGIHVKELLKKELYVKFNPETPTALSQFVADKIFVNDEKKRVTINEVVSFLSGYMKTLKLSVDY